MQLGASQQEQTQDAAQLPPLQPPPPLNAEQRAVTEADLDTPLLVLACAGTGKTTAIIERVAFMIQQVRLGGRGGL